MKVKIIKRKRNKKERKPGKYIEWKKLTIKEYKHFDGNKQVKNKNQKEIG